ncbi:MAG TPA: hypothetical protein VFZ09_12245 [Archangium sp.]|uniref:hypothetical protein n=1 Tax=Archangium sp. TaxID=1872627 RepID=UPI002E348241|nr:hypothetical protein [Archangium sp.]HEX5747007.1 hypothetical protein [Archangium sp.]
MPVSPGTGRICTLIGCESGFWLKVPVNLHFEQLRASTVTVCRNALCYSSSLATLAEPSGPDSGNRVTFPDPAQRDTLHTPLIHAEVRRAASGGYQLHVSYSPWASGELRNGDVYDVTLTDKRGRKPLKVHETVSYEVNQPNGPECPSTCLGIEIDKT